MAEALLTNDLTDLSPAFHDCSIRCDGVPAQVFEIFTVCTVTQEVRAVALTHHDYSILPLSVTLPLKPGLRRDPLVPHIHHPKWRCTTAKT